MQRAEIGQGAIVHLASGVGNIVLATPLLIALNRLGLTVEILMHADYQQTGDLLRHWSVVREIYSEPMKKTIRWSRYDFVIPAVPPFYWPRLMHLYKDINVVPRPPDSLF